MGTRPSRTATFLFTDKERLRLVGVGVLAGLLAGLVGGIAARIAMRIVALAVDQPRASALAAHRASSSWGFR